MLLLFMTKWNTNQMLFPSNLRPVADSILRIIRKNETMYGDFYACEANNIWEIIS